MAKPTLQDELEKRAGRAIVARSIYRWESAFILALTLVLAVFGRSLGFPGWQWWYWLILGLAGEIALVWSSIKEPEFRARAVAEMFREKFKPGTIRNDALRARVSKALEYRDRIHTTIGKGRESGYGTCSFHWVKIPRGAILRKPPVLLPKMGVDEWRTQK